MNSTIGINSIYTDIAAKQSMMLTLDAVSKKTAKSMDTETDVAIESMKLLSPESAHPILDFIATQPAEAPEVEKNTTKSDLIYTLSDDQSVKVTDRLVPVKDISTGAGHDLSETEAQFPPEKPTTTVDPQFISVFV